MGKLIFNLPDDLHDELRHKKVDVHKSMTQIITEALKEWLK